MLDEIARYNKERWEALAQAGVAYSRPFLDLDEAAARKVVDAAGLLGDLHGANVLCLAGGGGQQSAAFALLGSNVTVLDLSETQLERDRLAASHYGHSIVTEQGDMRDLSRFADNAFDMVWHAHSINFVPQVEPVFEGVARILRAGGHYHLSFHNPLSHGIDETKWTGNGYPISEPYINGAEIDQDRLFAVPEWTFDDEQGNPQRIRGPREFRHTLGAIINGLVSRGLMIVRFEEETSSALAPEPGSWEHFLQVTVPYMNLWAVKQKSLNQI